MRKTFLLLLCCFAARSGFACFNTYSGNEEGIAEGKSLVAQITEHQLKAPWASVRDALAKQIANAPTPETLNDYAVALCHTGNPQKAIEILLGIENARPNAYQTAANLGTAYELAGQNQNALHWIEEGIRRNPASHRRSEWIHVAILKAKLAIAENPVWLAEHDPLGLDFGTGRIPKRPPVLPADANGRPLPIPEIRDALQHQLHERIQFTPKPDAIVSRLIFDFANLVYLKDGSEFGGTVAFPLYQLAAEYSDKYVPPGGLMLLDDPDHPPGTIDRSALLLGLRMTHAPRLRAVLPPWYREPVVVVVVCLCGLLYLMLVRGAAAIITGVPMHLTRLILILPVLVVGAHARSQWQYVGWLAIGFGLLGASYLPARLRKCES